MHGCSAITAITEPDGIYRNNLVPLVQEPFSVFVLTLKGYVRVFRDGSKRPRAVISIACIPITNIRQRHASSGVRQDV
jgi:hypothetical protein